ncbi:MAG: hypothetical protein LBF62_12630 [Tannerellaceae bacterium]|jgi:hypothetical protein|nr:hypothetical protein [Tannerellaceae bacterium]
MYNLHSTSAKIFNRYKEDERLEKWNVDKTAFGYGTAFTYYIMSRLQGKVYVQLRQAEPEASTFYFALPADSLGIFRVSYGE